MKREELKALGLTDEQIDKVMSLNGADIEGQKSKTTALQTELDGVKAQLTEAGKQIESFKGMNIDGIKAAADEWKTKAEKAEADRVAEVSRLKLDYAIENALTGAKAKNTKAVRALLDQGTLKLKDDGTLEGIDDQLKKVKEANPYLFADEKDPPRIVTGGNNTNVQMDAFEAALMKGANLPVGKG